MNLFSACLVFCVKNTDHPEASFCEELWTICQSENELQAVNSLLEKGRNHEESFTNHLGDNIEWNFKGIKALRQLEWHDNVSEITSLSSDTESFVEHLNFQRKLNFSLN